MLKKDNMRASLSVFALATAMAYAPASSAALASYSQDFEGLDAASPTALGIAGGDGYRFFADVWFDAVGGIFLYPYGPGTAPNGGPGFSAIAGGEGGAAQGLQYLNVYSDYNNGDHGNGYAINTNVFQEQTIGAGDIGSTWTFSGQFKAPSSGGIAPPSTANAFVKTLDPGSGFAQTNLITVDTSTASNSIWTDFSISIDLTSPLLDGQLLQFGFNTTATNYNDSGVYYDNLNFSSAVPVPAAVWLMGSGLLGLVGVARRRKAA